MPTSKGDLERARQIDALLNKIEPKLRNAYRKALESLSEEISLKDIEEALDSGDLYRASEAINTLITGQVLIEFNKEIQNAVQAGGDLAASWAKADKIQFRLNVTESNTARFIREAQTMHISNMTQEIKDSIGDLVLRRVNEGVNPKVIAREIRENIKFGLTPKQSRAVDNFERLLREDKSAALTRALRDKRFDRTVIRAINDQTDLSEKQIKRMVQRYKEKYLKYRSETIARTEAIRLVSQGNHQFWEQAVADEIVDEQLLVRKWIPTLDTKTRDWHRSIPRLNPEGVALKEPFKTDYYGETLMYPGDPNGSAANTINCRCAVFTRIKAKG